jgi:uncharacterized membrane protein
MAPLGHKDPFSRAIDAVLRHIGSVKTEHLCYAFLLAVLLCGFSYPMITSDKFDVRMFGMFIATIAVLFAIFTGIVHLYCLRQGIPVNSDQENAERGARRARAAHEREKRR